MSTLNLAREISAFNRLLPRLRCQYGHSWVVFVGDDCKGGFSAFDEATSFAFREFPAEHFLIRHTDATEPQVPFVVVED
jgi:hypothetical protein